MKSISESGEHRTIPISSLPSFDDDFEEYDVSAQSEDTVLLLKPHFKSSHSINKGPGCTSFSSKKERSVDPPRYENVDPSDCTIPSYVELKSIVFYECGACLKHYVDHTPGCHSRDDVWLCIGCRRHHDSPLLSAWIELLRAVSSLNKSVSFVVRPSASVWILPYRMNGDVRVVIYAEYTIENRSYLVEKYDISLIDDHRKEREREISSLYEYYLEFSPVADRETIALIHQSYPEVPLPPLSKTKRTKKQEEILEAVNRAMISAGIAPVCSHRETPDVSSGDDFSENKPSKKNKPSECPLSYSSADQMIAEILRRRE